MRLGVDLEVRKVGNGFELVSRGLIATRAEAAKTADAMNKGMQGTTVSTIALGNALADIGLKALRAVAEGFKFAITTGMEFNALLETSQIGLASIISQTTDFGKAQGKQLTATQNFNEAQSVSVQMQKDLQVAAIQTAATYGQLLVGAQSVLSVHKGAFDTEQVVKFTKSISQAAAAIDPMLLHENQFSQEIRGLLEGDLSRASRLSRIIFNDYQGNAKGLREEFERIRKQGPDKLFEFIQKRMEAFAIGGARSMQTFTVSLSNLKDAFQQAMGEGTKELLGGATQVIRDLTSQIVTFDKAGNATFNQKLVDGVSALASVFLDLGKAAVWALQIVPPLFKTVGVAWHSLKAIFFEALAGISGLTAGVMNGLQALVEGFASSIEVWGGRIGKFVEKFGALIPGLTAEHGRFMQQWSKDTGSSMRNVGGGLGVLAADHWKNYAELKKEAKIRWQDAADAWVGKGGAKPGSKPKKIKLGSQGSGEDEQTESQLSKEVAALRRTNAQKVATAESEALTRQKAQEARVHAINAEAITQETRAIDLQNEIAELSIRYGEERLSILLRQSSLTKSLALEEDKRLEIATRKKVAEEEGRSQREVDKFRVDKLKLQNKLDEHDAFKKRGLASAEGFDPKVAKQEIDSLTKLIASERSELEKKIATINKSGIAERRQQAIVAAQELSKQEIAIWEEKNRHLLVMYEGLAQAITSSITQAFEDLSSGRGLKDALQTMVNGFRSAMGNVIGSWVSEAMKKLTLAATGTPDSRKEILDAAGNLKGFEVIPGRASDPKAKRQLAGLQTASALYGLYSSRQETSTAAGTVSGAMQGAAIGAQFGKVAGIWGAIAGAVVGGVLSWLGNKEKQGKQPRFEVHVVNGKLTVTGFSGAGKSDVDSAMKELNNTLSASMEGVNSILKAFPKAISDQLIKPKEFLPEGLIGEAVRKVKTTVFSFKKKSFAGGMTADELKHFNQVTLPEMIYEAYAPVFEAGLAAMGVTEEKLRELMARGPAFDAKEAFARLQGFIEVVAGFVDSEAFNKMTSGELTEKARGQFKATPMESITKIGDKIIKLAAGFSELTTDEQIARGKEILELEKERQEATLRYLNEIRETQEKIFKSIDTQIADMGLSEMGPGSQREALMARMGDVFGKIGSAKSPEELAELAAEYQQLTGMVYEATKKLRDGLRDLIDGFKGLDEIMAPERSPFQKLGDLQEKIEKSFDKMKNATKLDDQIAAAQELYAATKERYELEKQMLDEITTAIEAINTMFSDSIAEFKLESEVTAATARGASPTEIANIRINDLMKRQQALYDRLKNAGSAAEVTQITTDINQNAHKLFDLLGRTPEAAAQLIASLEDFNRIANAKLDAFADAIKAQDAANKSRVDAAIGVLETAFGKLPVAVTAATDALGLLKDTLATRFTELTNEVIVANQNLLGIIEGILLTLRTGIDGLFPNAPGAGAPGPPSGGGKEPIEMPGVPEPRVIQPVVYVTVAGSAEPFINHVVTETTVRATQAVAASQNSRWTQW